MRLYLKLSRADQLLPWHYQQNLVGVFHRWLGENIYHDTLSLYSLSWLSGAKGTAKGLAVENEALWFIGSPDSDLIKKVVQGIQENARVAFGMKVKEIIIKETPQFPNEIKFNLASPVLVKRKVGDEIVHYSFKDPTANELITATLKAKLKKAGLVDESITVAFDHENIRAKRKVVTYKGIQNKANYCPVILKGSSK
ncbi:MAG: CRISPR-associated endoribonuclease Cas6, partial [Bacteroidota bacterium]